MTTLRRLVLLIAALLLALSGVAAAFEPPTPDIVGGTEADDGEYPFMVALRLNGNMRCGGSLVRPDWVLTAKHCVAGFPPGAFEVQVGAWDLADPNSGEPFDVVQIINHGPSDTSLLRISGEAAVAPVRLATPADSGLYPPGADSTVIGWGDTQNTPPGTPRFPTKLREITIPVVSDAACGAAWAAEDPPYDLVEELEICAGGEFNRDSCSGDSGGPLSVLDGQGKWLQIGIVSAGSLPCGAAGLPGIYVQVDAIESWVTANAGPAATCGGFTITIQGTSAGEVINGTPGNDVIAAGAGNDTVNGNGGDDVLCGEEGADTLNGGTGNDVLIGGPGNDTLDGDPGNDTADYSDAPGPVTVNLNTGVATGHGTDTLSGVWNIVGSPFDDRLFGNAGINALYGGPGDDSLNGKGGDDSLFGEGGDDLLNGRGGDDLLDGGPDVDKVTYIHSPSGVSVNLNSGLVGGGQGADTVVAVENARGSNHDDTLIGSHLANELIGGHGDDDLFGRAGDDVLKGNRGTDTADGEGGPADFCRAETVINCEL